MVHLRDIVLVQFQNCLVHFRNSEYILEILGVFQKLFEHFTNSQRENCEIS